MSYKKIGICFSRATPQSRLNRAGKGTTSCITPLHDIVDFEIVGSHTLKIEFDDKTHQIIDFKPVLAGVLYEPLLELEFFSQVRLDPEARNLVWPNGADFDPAELHGWPDVAENYVRVARERREKAAIS